MKRSTFLGFCLMVCASSGLACGTERWPVKTMGDVGSEKLDAMLPIIATVADLVAMVAPDRKALDQHMSERFPAEQHTYRVTGWLLGFKHEDDEDFHVVIEDLEIPGVTMVVEMPSPNCVAPSFRPTAAKVRIDWEARFGKATSKFKNVRRHGIRVEFIGPAFFDFIHGQTGVAKNGIEQHPIFSWREIFSVTSMTASR